MENGFTLSEIICAMPSKIYEAWLSSESHAAMTGSSAKVYGNLGGEFSALWRPGGHSAKLWK